MAKPPPLVLSGALHGLVSVAMGAFGAHGLRQALEPQALGWVETGARYQMYSALFLLALPALQAELGRPLKGVGRAFNWGGGIFAGSLYIMALSGWRWLGAVTPLGGLLMMLGFSLLALAALRRD